ncbi:MAG: adenylate/guanylate cyclase domain-containing protein [Phycisphaerae bacterium]
MTCFFSDLAGFTTLAEQHDSHRIQRVLNTYLDRMSEVLFQYEAFLNKFLGDGVMAFFNPNVNPQPEHSRLACEAALMQFEALEKLQRDEGGGEELYTRLSMRIGIATGVAGVGRFGSHRKADYTVIGDVANLAARLGRPTRCSARGCW